ncbi:hypothetical protein [Microbacterium sp.]|uniref:hypothetical protein n=1 Tax=Microbacterium sp. TaxID=51671 RepID=UPI0025FB4E8E|nr:hypothetical protein [Microbacterium sp.]
MEILLGFIFGAAVGGALHYLQPGRASRGAALAPVSGAVVGGIAWLILTWAGITTETPWIWVAPIALPAIVISVMLGMLTRSRTAHDARERVRLKIA